jgi:tetratricopeptide (TPR) repeat protein
MSPTLASMRLTAVIATVLLAARSPAAQASAQACATLTPAGARSSITWIEPHPTSAVTRRALELVAELGYDSIEVDSTARFEIDAVKQTWPRTSAVSQWRDLPYPGARLRVTIEPAEEWTRIESEVRLICAPTFSPPPLWAADIDVQQFVLHHTLGDVADPLASHFHDAPTEIPGRTCAPLREGDRKLRICRDLVRRRPDDPDAHLQYALALIRFYRAQQARESISKVFALAGPRLDLYRLLGGALLEESQYRDAERLFRRATVLWPDSTEVHVQLGITLARSGKSKEALGPLERGIRLGTVEPEAYYRAGLALEREKQHEQAHTYLQRALALYQKVLPARRRDVGTWAAMGRTASELGLHAEAMSYFERAHHLNPTYLGRDRQLRDALGRSLKAAGPQAAAAMPDPP